MVAHVGERPLDVKPPLSEPRPRLRSHAVAQTSSTDLPLGAPLPAVRLSNAVDGATVDLGALSAGKRGTLVMFLCNHCPFVVHVRRELARRGERRGRSGLRSRRHQLERRRELPTGRARRDGEPRPRRGLALSVPLRRDARGRPGVSCRVHAGPLPLRRPRPPRLPRPVRRQPARERQAGDRPRPAAPPSMRSLQARPRRPTRPRASAAASNGRAEDPRIPFDAESPYPGSEGGAASDPGSDRPARPARRVRDRLRPRGAPRVHERRRGPSVRQAHRGAARPTALGALPSGPAQRRSATRSRASSPAARRPPRPPSSPPLGRWYELEVYPHPVGAAVRRARRDRAASGRRRAQGERGALPRDGPVRARGHGHLRLDGRIVRRRQRRGRAPAGEVAGGDPRGEPAVAQCAHPGRREPEHGRGSELPRANPRRRRRRLRVDARGSERPADPRRDPGAPSSGDGSAPLLLHRHRRHGPQARPGAARAGAAARGGRASRGRRRARLQQPPYDHPGRRADRAQRALADGPGAPGPRRRSSTPPSARRS